VSKTKNYSKVDVLVVGAGPAGLAAAITLKKKKPDLDICVLDKAHEPGGHNLSGAVMEEQALIDLLEIANVDWRNSEPAREIFGRRIEKDNVLLFLGSKRSVTMMPAIKMAGLIRLGFGQMVHEGDYIVSISKLTKWLTQLAKDVGVEVLHGLAAEDILMDDQDSRAVGVRLIEQGLDKEKKQQPNYVPGETVAADVIILAEGCDGLLTEIFVSKANLRRFSNQLFSVCVKELIEVSPEQYQKFGDNRVVHAMGYPIWTPLLGPAMFGGGIMYSFGNNQIAVGMIVGADWKFCNFNPQEALVRFKEHEFVKQFIDGGTVVEAGAKMIPEGGYYAIPRDPRTNSIGKNNVLILGDSAGFVNMLKIKGLHNAINSGIAAGTAIAENIAGDIDHTAVRYTELLQAGPVEKEMLSARNFRQTVAKFGNSIGMPLSSLGGLLPRFNVEKDYEAMTTDQYELATEKPFDKDSFTAMALVEHREEEPCHLIIDDPEICETKCKDTYGDLCGEYGRPCVAFCPAGVYEMIHDEMKPANPSNCLHCKTCQNKCPYDNIRWVVPEGGGGPRFRNM